MLLVILKANNFLEGFMKKHCKKQIKKNLELKKKEKVINYMLIGKSKILFYRFYLRFNWKV